MTEIKYVYLFTTNSTKKKKRNKTGVKKKLKHLYVKHKYFIYLKLDILCAVSCGKALQIPICYVNVYNIVKNSLSYS